MADKTKKFTVKSNKVLGEKSKEKDIVVDIPNTSLKGQSSIPSILANSKQPTITTNVKYGGIGTKTDKISLEVDLKGLGEERQPDGTRFVYKPDVFTVNEIRYIALDKPFIELSVISDIVGLEINPFVEHAGTVSSFDFKDVEIVKEDLSFALSFVSQTIEKPFSDSYGVSDFNTITVSPFKSDTYFTADESFRVFEKFLSDRVSVTDDAFDNLNPDDDQTAGVVNPEFDTTGVLDEDTKGITKSIVDLTSLLDLHYFDYGQVKEEYLLLADVKEVALLKVFGDSYTLSDTFDFTFNKDLVDVFTISDTDSKVVESGKSENLATPDEVNNILYKSIVDIITATDDAFGNLNPDDDQAAGTQKPAIDFSGVADIDYRIITKAIFDTVKTISSLEIKDDSIKDVSQIQDLLASSLVKVLEETFGNSDETKLHPQTSKLDNTTVNDILTAVVQFFYDINDTTNITSSGNINKQDYFAEEFTNDDYTGENFSF